MKYSTLFKIWNRDVYNVLKSGGQRSLGPGDTGGRYSNTGSHSRSSEELTIKTLPSVFKDTHKREGKERRKYGQNR